ncbi:glycolate oxidase iron-sulfur subunit [Halomonas litopenaei]|uniref:Glycolate oxidase iron-sulfur subunit n=1 Tax=Halomonas litopenaei TaxID=2109328 RepID=A0ABX5IYN4_9GAMM|nr:MULTISPECIES: glycolate oxidase subunit GlcF [Halomonas]HAR08291.1 glycolate oxidase iron-sulfur subunit [Cobetia sp.]MAR71428.1 glycolate oxidase iron-sulfur subunit [Halomonas sp.]MBS8269361.1 glycolate oxidase iron-sulfur subunit [Halomonas litopenaei]PTL91774.1 glycolate oxidase iron-sulfur subunit [Halomonas sp. SYSU XM8]PTL94810.1 glycolate oxidase iron-sulfur subunit [Halomonas litopenaei]|tara:strand:- start:3622 stop:4854 length:1233 start_codon:yes stop_codon:yes gene_type:complete
MQTHFSEKDLEKPHIREADRVLRSCVHCGFCNATCPTYQLLGDERDGPRGRIYLMKEMLESPEDDDQITEETRLHLDRCLTCRNCETTCPSGVEYHKLLDIGRAEIERRVPRSTSDKALRFGLRKALVEPGRFKALLALGQTFKPLVPGALKSKMPPAPVDAGKRPDGKRHPRQMLILEGCVQPGLSPNTNAATARVLDRLGVGLTPAPEVGCCGAIDFHLNAQEAGRERARRNIDAWLPHLDAGCEAIIQTASGCGAFVKEYVEVLADDPDYAEKARRVSEAAKDLVEVLGQEDLTTLDVRADQRLAFHCPCTLQHAQKLNGAVETVLTRMGFTLTPVRDGHLCCGSAGTYSITQPELSRQLRDNKMDALEEGKPEVVVTANIGCQTHLAATNRTPVRHWIEIVDEALG